MNEISENTLNEELNRIFLVKFQFRENETRLSTTWRSKIWSEEIQKTHCSSHSVSLNLKDDNYWKPTPTKKCFRFLRQFRVCIAFSLQLRTTCDIAFSPGLALTPIPLNDRYGKTRNVTHIVMDVDSREVQYRGTVAVRCLLFVQCSVQLQFRNCRCLRDEPNLVAKLLFQSFVCPTSVVLPCVVPCFVLPTVEYTSALVESTGSSTEKWCCMPVKTWDAVWWHVVFCAARFWISHEGFFEMTNRNDLLLPRPPKLCNVPVYLGCTRATLSLKAILRASRPCWLNVSCLRSCHTWLLLHVLLLLLPWKAGCYRWCCGESHGVGERLYFSRWHRKGPVQCHIRLGSWLCLRDKIRLPLQKLQKCPRLPRNQKLPLLPRPLLSSRAHRPCAITEREALTMITVRWYVIVSHKLFSRSL